MQACTVELNSTTAQACINGPLIKLWSVAPLCDTESESPAFLLHLDCCVAPQKTGCAMNAREIPRYRFTHMLLPPCYRL